MYSKYAGANCTNASISYLDICFATRRLSIVNYISKRNYRGSLRMRIWIFHLRSPILDNARDSECSVRHSHNWISTRRTVQHKRFCRRSWRSPPGTDTSYVFQSVSVMMLLFHLPTPGRVMEVVDHRDSEV